MSEASEAILALAQAAVGLSDGADPDRYRALVAPGETPERAAEMAKASGCGLVVRGILGSLIQDRRLTAPYEDGRVMSDLVAMAREADAWSSYVSGAEPGDLVFWSGPEHVCVVEDVSYGNITSIDGGQRAPDGSEAILRRARAIDSRPIEGHVDMAKLLEHFGAMQ